MTSSIKTIRIIHIIPRILAPKVNAQQYLTNKKEPAELITEVKPSNQNVKDAVIKETYLRKAVFRRLAIKMRRENS